MIKLIIFDWDDVFSLGSTEGYYKCYRQAVSGVGVALSIKDENKRIKSKWGASHQEIISELLKEKPELIAQACQLYEDNLFGDTFVGCLSVAPGSAKLLSRLAKKYTLALATGVHPGLLQERVMPKLNIPPDVFSQIVTAYDLDDPTHAKPNPYVCKLIMSTQRVPAENTVMVGDARNDVLMAQSSGIEPIVVLTGHLNREEAINLGVCHIISSVSELETVLSAL